MTVDFQKEKKGGRGGNRGTISRCTESCHKVGANTLLQLPGLAFIPGGFHACTLATADKASLVRTCHTSQLPWSMDQEHPPGVFQTAKIYVRSTIVGPSYEPLLVP